MAAVLPSEPNDRLGSVRRKRYETLGSLLAAKKSDQGSGIREAEEARALLEDQLHSLYWWVFNAFKMKGFIRAKALDELQRSAAAGDKSHSERGDFADADVSPEEQTF